MSGALVSLVAKGVQDVYLINNDSESSFFKSKYTRYTNFAQAPKQIDFTGVIQNNGSTSIFIRSLGDLINQVWLEGTDIVGNLTGTTFQLYIGGQLIDSQTFDFMADAWQIYMAESYSKCVTINNNISQSDINFFPLHFFFCDNEMFLPILALQYHQVEIRINWGSTIQTVPNLVAYGNYIFLDTKEREAFVKKQLDFLITQVQTISGSINSIDLSLLNHPVKSIYFGYPQTSNPANYWTFTGASILLNSNYLLENMTPTYFHTVQGYYNTKYGNINFNNTQNSPVYTQYYTYNFCLDATSYKPTGTCNFSRLDKGKLQITGGLSVPSGLTTLTLYAVNYNVLRIKEGVAGILFSN
jgi:hypothetical protein